MAVTCFIRYQIAALLALLNPLAALISFNGVDNSDDAQRGADACQAFARRMAARPNLLAPEAPKGTTGRPAADARRPSASR